MAVPRPEPPSSPRDDLPPFVFAGKTDTGRRRSSNQDRFLATTVGLPGGPATLLAVADGMGGAAGGEVASGHAVEELTRVLGQALPERSSGELLSDGIAAANRTIYEHAQAEPALYGMGTTLVAVLVAGDQMIVAHVGDSRAGPVRDGTLRRLTADHSWV
ncbi:MAG: protein phosphatase 2C domain-containing protein [Dehalococcoidia bacterium]